MTDTMKNNIKSDTHSHKLQAEIKKTWGKLTEQEIGFHESKPDKFFEAIETKYGIGQKEAEKTMQRLDAECGMEKDSYKAASKTARM